MDQDTCLHCKKPFEKYRDYQKYCGRHECQKARKRKWQKDALTYDPDYKARQKQANIDWRRNNRSYWKTYRKRNPEKADKNKILQRVRNQTRRLHSIETTALKAMFHRINKREINRLIAKMDVSNRSDNHPFNEFWLIPLIAKMDVLKVTLSVMADHPSDE